MNILSGDVMPINIFISSRMKERSIEKEKRDLAKEAIEELSGSKFKPILFEYEPPYSEHIKDWWRSKIKQEDTKFLVLILNNTLSAAVFDEFRTASEYGVNTFVFLMNKNRVLAEKLRIINYPESGLIISDDELDWFYRRIKSTKFKKIKGDDEFKKDIKDAVSQYLEVSPEVPHELKANILNKDDSELKRILKVYVKPVKYDDAYSILYKNRFLVITGDANIGKTSMAQHLADRIMSDHNLTRMIKIDGGRTDVALFKNLKNSIIIFDDVFGKSKFSDSGDYSGNIKEVVDLKDNNFVILTTRREILDEANKRQTRFTEYYTNIEDNLKEFSQEGSYSDDALREILEKHLNYYYEVSKIGNSELEIAQKNTEKIIKNLRFPHNIDLLVKEELKKATNGEKKLDEAIKDAKHIKIIAKNWFLNLDDKRKYFIFTVALFPGLDGEVFDRIYEKIIVALQRRHIGLTTEDLNALRGDTSAYITETGRIGFRHPNYWEGVGWGIEEGCTRDLVEIIYTLEELAKDEDTYVRWRVVDALIEIGKVKPDKALLLLKQLTNDRFVHSAYALGEIGKVKPDKTLLLLKELASDVRVEVRQDVAYALGEISKVNQDNALPVLKQLANDKDTHIRRNVVDALRKIGKVKPDEALPLLKQLAKDEDTYVRRDVVDALRKIGKAKPDKVLLLLKQQANDKEELVRWAVVDTLIEISKFKPDEALPVLKEWANDKGGFVERAVVGALREISKVKPNEALPLLKQLVKDEDAYIRRKVVDALREISKVKPNEALPLLKQLANDKEGFVRRAVADALIEIGKVKPNEALLLLKQLAKDDRVNVRWAAEDAIRVIQRF